MKKKPPINEALQGCLTPEEVAAGGVAYDVDYWGIEDSVSSVVKPKVFYMCDLVETMKEAVVEARKEQLMEFKKYKRSGLAEMRPYIPGEDLALISVSKEDTPEEGGMIARNPHNHADQWYVAKDYFAANFELEEI